MKSLLRSSGSSGISGSSDAMMSGRAKHCKFRLHSQLNIEIIINLQV